MKQGTSLVVLFLTLNNTKRVIFLYYPYQNTESIWIKLLLMIKFKHSIIVLVVMLIQIYV